MVKDIHPNTPITALKRDFSPEQLQYDFSLEFVSALTGMSSNFIRKVFQKQCQQVTLQQVLLLLDLDSFHETFVPRSQIPSYLLKTRLRESTQKVQIIHVDQEPPIIEGCVTNLLPLLPKKSINCVVTSPPYWGTRLYDEHYAVQWADGEECPYGNEQTPEGFIRHTIEILYLLKPALANDASVWFNLMDSYNTRTQIRKNAVETLRAMRGGDSRKWTDYQCRRYSSGHSFLKDGEQCFIPARVAERASRIGYYAKSLITWKKIGSMPEPTQSRVTRELEYIIHLAVQRTPYFDRTAYLHIPEFLGGRNQKFESEKITDVWCLATANGTDGHGAQFPIALPGRCIAISTKEDDIVLDPFMGSGTTALASISLNRCPLGFEISSTYIEIALKRMKSHHQKITPLKFEEPALQAVLL